jgi:hypothetical protein
VADHLASGSGRVADPAPDRLDLQDAIALGAHERLEDAALFAADGVDADTVVLVNPDAST